MKNFIFILIFFSATLCNASHDIKTNNIHMGEAPEWVTTQKVDAIVDKIQQLLEWDIRRIEVYWYKTQSEFENVHNYGPTVLAISKKSDSTVHLGPRVKEDNFNGVFGHELVHIISFQKYKGAIPLWLEEGLANHLSQQTKVDYHWLTTQPVPEDVRNLTHPFGGSVDNIRYHYMASQALIEMIADKCDLSNLIRLSVGRKLEDKLDTYCGIKDITAAFKVWLDKHR